MVEWYIVEWLIICEWGLLKMIAAEAERRSHELFHRNSDLIVLEIVHLAILLSPVLWKTSVESGHAFHSWLFAKWILTRGFFVCVEGPYQGYLIVMVWKTLKKDPPWQVLFDHFITRLLKNLRGIFYQVAIDSKIVRLVDECCYSLAESESWLASIWLRCVLSQWCFSQPLCA